MKKNSVDFDRLTFGVCYYPEHWDESMWADDLKNMKSCGIEIVRIAEFAWNRFEPREGEYNFDFFDRFMDLALKEDIKVIFCTPTATAPIWLSEKHPEILNADIDGHLIYQGIRRQNNLTSPIYREYAAKITEQLAKHYCPYPNVIGWQLDNEINCERDSYYSKSDHIAFREYLKSKFKTIDNLNPQMGTAFWNQTVNDWDEVYLTRRTTSPGETNPHFKLEEKRFISKTVIDFFKLQADIIKKYRRKDQFITTNGLFNFIDYHRLADEVLDFHCYDNYPNFAYDLRNGKENSNGMMDRNSSYKLSLVRSISNPFGIMEQQSGGGGWNFRMLQPMPKPGQMRLWTMQAVAHGADFISFFRWRTCRFGTEMYWHGINDPSNKPNRRLEELRSINKDRLKISEIAGSLYQADVAIIKDYDNEWDTFCDKWQETCSEKSYYSWFCCLQKNHIPFDFLNLSDKTDLAELLRYKHIIYPHPAILTESRVSLLTEYIKNGGTVIFGCRTGIKNINGSYTSLPYPGLAADICGTEVEEFTLLSNFDEPVYIVCGEKKATAPVYNDVLKATDGEVIGFFKNNHYDGKPAIIKKTSGKGSAYYVGSVFNEDTASLLAEITGIKSPAEKLFELPPELEFSIREKDGVKFIFILNYKDYPIEFTIKTEMEELLSGQKINGKYLIEKYGCLVFKV